MTPIELVGSDTDTLAPNLLCNLGEVQQTGSY